MKKIALLPLCVALSLSGGAYADNVIRMNAPISEAETHWEPTDPGYSEWEAISSMYECTGATPSTDAYVQGQTFLQTKTGCSQDFERIRYPQDINTVTGKLRPHGVGAAESKTEFGLSYQVDAVGSRIESEIIYGAGAGTRGGSGRFAGIYARKGELDIGTLQMTAAGDRVLAYMYRNNSSSICQFRFGTTGPDGWITGGATTKPSMVTNVKQYTKAELYLADGTKYGTYAFGSASSSSEGGSIRTTNVPCEAIDAFYSNTSFFSKVVLLP